MKTQVYYSDELNARKKKLGHRYTWNALIALGVERAEQLEALLKEALAKVEEMPAQEIK